MSIYKHSPAPWRRDSEYSDDIVAANGQIIATMCVMDTEDETNANSSLFCAVPDLLESLEEMTALYASVAGRDNSGDPTDTDAILTAEAAIRIAKESL